MAPPVWRNIKLQSVFADCWPSLPLGTGWHVSGEINEGNFMIVRAVLVVAALAIGATAVVAQSDPIATRRAGMKAVGEQNRVATDMIEGKRPFNAADAKKVLATFNEHATKLKTMFPDTSRTGDTNALPTIWENKADFEAKLAKFAADAKDAEGKISSLDNFKTEMADVRKNCGGCHQTYRKRQS
jgi:cytochrome c556